jgi:hypothetical protein
MVLLWNKAALVLVTPDIRVNENNRLHNAEGPAVAWLGIGGGKYYYWHGIRVTEKVILTPEKLTQADLVAERDSEISRVIVDRLGWDRYMEIARVFLLDRWTDPGTGLLYELHDFKRRKNWRFPRLLRMQAPRLKDGSRRFYVEPVHPELKNCRAARKWQFRKPDGSWPEVEECNANPELVFGNET